MDSKAPARPDFIAVDWNGSVVPVFGEAPYSQALETLNKWRESGVFLVVVSCAEQAHIEAEVARIGLRADEIFGVHEKESTLLELRMRMGAGVYIGDHPSDARAAEVAGLPFFQACCDGQAAIAGREAGFNDWSEASLLLGFSAAS